MPAREIAFSEVSEILSYNSETGELTWKKAFHSSRIGKRAGSIDRQGYWTVKIDGRRYLCSRLAWCLHYGSIDPELQIDHIDRNPSNNKLSNLRLTTASVNCMNRATKYGKPRYYTKHRCGYQVQINARYVGLYKTAEEAELKVREMTNDQLS